MLNLSKTIAVIKRDWKISVSMFALVMVGVSVYQISKYQKQVSQITKLKDGAGVCFSRVMQSYVAKVVGNTNSNYLSQNFMELTEECYSDLSTRVQAANFAEISKIEKSFNTLAVDSHWIHNKMSTMDNNSGLLSNLGTRFTQLESLKDSLLDELNSSQSKISSKEGTWNLIVLFNLIFAPLFLLVNILAEHSRDRMNESIELESEKFVEATSRDGKQMEFVLEKAFQTNHMPQALRLFQAYRALGSERISQTTVDHGYNEIPAVSLEKVDSVAQASSQVAHPTAKQASVKAARSSQRKLSSYSFDNLMTSVLELVSGKVFSEGIKLDVDLVENINILGQEEALQHIIYRSLTTAINSANTGDSIRVSSRLISNKLYFNIEIENDSFFSKECETLRMLTRELAADAYAEPSFKRLEHNKSSLRIKLIQASSEGRLTNIQKGTKRDILNRINS